MATYTHITRVEDGTKTAPGYSFRQDTDCGLYRIGTNNVGISVADTKTVDIATALVGITGALTATLDIGMVATKKLYLDGVAMTGNTYVYEKAADTLVLVAGAAEVFNSTATNTLMAGTNFGFATTDVETLGSSMAALNLGARGYLGFGTAYGKSTSLAQGAYYDGAWKFKAGGEPACLVDLNGNTGALTLKVAAAGSADAAITWVTAISIASAGIATFVKAPVISTSDNPPLIIQSNSTADAMITTYMTGASPTGQCGAWCARRANGTIAAPSVVKDEDVLGRFYAQAYDDAGFENAGFLEWWADEDWSATAHGSYIRLEYIQPTTTTVTTAAIFREPTATGQTCLWLRRQSGAALTEVQVQWKDGASIGAGDKVLILAS